MHGEKLYPTTVTCSECGEHVTLMVDTEDVARLREDDLPAETAFSNRDGTPYLSPLHRELFISGICAKCWRKLDVDVSLGAPFG
jgi:hypothetical protein